MEDVKAKSVAMTLTKLVAATSALRSSNIGRDVVLVLLAIDSVRASCVPTLAVIVPELGIPKPTVYRHVLTLQERGLLKAKPVHRSKHHEFYLTTAGELALAHATQAVVAAMEHAPDTYTA